jgi:23S rRNA (cytidine1920-2'-O)/16S rRNA (cytidine1409-2'-O)-methyltransferase
MARRADQFLVEAGLAPTRSTAQRLIADQAVSIIQADQALGVVTKAGQLIQDGQSLVLTRSDETRFVSRSGLKLEAALQEWQLDVKGLTALDIGQSTGGFTDCLLQRGVASVVGIDVGHGQLNGALRTNARVRCIEGVNARNAAEIENALSAGRDAQHANQFELVVVDVSFISLRLVLPTVMAFATDRVIALFKPQFEVGKALVGKRGIVTTDVAMNCLAQFERWVKDSVGEFQLKQSMASPIRGGDGNQEYLLNFERLN